MLERLTDEDIRQIITQAINRVAPVTGGNETRPVVDIDMTDLSSSPPLSSPTLAPSSSLPASDITKHSQPPTDEKEESDVPDQSPLFPAYPQLTKVVLNTLISLSNGDARAALSLLELVLTSPPTTSASNLLSSLRSSVSTSFDRTGDDRYDMISALHKSVRGSDGDAAMYWLARMLSQGEDPLYIARRMVVCASEDIGLADNHALPLVIFLLL